MEKRLLFTFALTTSVVLLSASVSLAIVGVPGSHQDGLATEISPPDWTPATAPLMTEDPNTAGLFSLDISAANLGVGSVDPNAFFRFKILEDTGTLDWGTSTQLTPIDSFFYTDGAGTTTLTINKNTINDGFLPTTNRVTSSTDATKVPGFFATGDWMDEAGGLADWNAGDPNFEMSADPNDANLYSKTVTISTAGAYQWKGTQGDFSGQWGTDGRNQNAGTWAFNTVEAAQDVTFLLDISKGAISFSTTTFTPGDTNNDTFVTLADFDPIKNNFLNSTFIRSEGDLNGDGVVDAADFHEWKTAFLALPLSAASSAVPEPSSLALMVFACFGAFTHRRRGIA